MKIEFEDENGSIVLQGVDIFIPCKGDLIVVNHKSYKVNYRFIDYDNEMISVDIEQE